MVEAAEVVRAGGCSLLLLGERERERDRVSMSVSVSVYVCLVGAKCSAGMVACVSYEWGAELYQRRMNEPAEEQP